ncbi:alpha/beta fold hydrolase [Thermostichus vulcanus]|uniref:Alpha/beta hydrolase n=1 Tax=Thermostichus vulcanus str. 'Rupite' TaxID=2813851 RepID=A0ABT0CEA6_THEVL|nr:alpha/beta hydrolase [Thermostichus vulcanus]MCJ2544116.1 alpha/beta hydrolase [Thermostichus vulcanus str. 'Rupite']
MSLISLAPEQCQDSLDSNKLYFIDVKGIQTRFYKDGQGEPLILLHGGNFGSLYSLDSWSLNLPGLAKEFQVIALDKIGQGYTDNPETDADYTYERLFAHTCDFFRSQGIEKAHWVGHSRGAHLATYVALQHPEWVKSLIMVDTSTTAPEEPTIPSGQFYAEVEAMIPPGADYATIVRSEPEAQAFSKEQITDDFISRMETIFQLSKMQLAREKMRILGASTWIPSLNKKREEVLARIAEGELRVPTLIMWGYNDRSAPFSLGINLYEKVCRTVPSAELYVVNGAGHYSFREQPQAFNTTLKSFCLR